MAPIAIGIEKITPLVDKIESLDASMQNLTDEELRNKTFEFKNRLQQGETLDDIYQRPLL